MYSLILAAGGVAQIIAHPAVRAMIEDAQQQRLFLSNRTMYRLNRRMIQHGHLRRYRRLGNTRAVVLRSMDMYQLAYH